MSLLIRSEKDLPLLEKAHLDKKLNKLSKTISESFARKINGEDSKKPIQFSTDPDKTQRVKVEFAKVKDHLLSKIHEARDTSFYNILALYFEQYFKLIKHGEKETNHMTDAQFDEFLKEINVLNTKLGIVYEPVYPEDYKGYILMQVDRSNLDKPPFSLTGSFVRDEPDQEDECKFTGQFTKLDPNKTFTDIEKHRQIKYIGGKEYYMSFGEYGAIYLQGNVDSKGEQHGKKLSELRARFVQQMSSGNFDLDDDDEGSDYGSDYGDDDDDYRGPRPQAMASMASMASFVPGPRETATLSKLRADAQPRPSLVPPDARPSPPALTPETPKPGPKREPPKKASSARDLPQTELKSALKRGSASSGQIFADAAAEAEVAGRGAAGHSRDESALLPSGVTSGPPGALAEQVAAAARARPSAIAEAEDRPRDTLQPTPTPAAAVGLAAPAQGGGRRKKHKKSKKYYKKTRAKKRKKTKKR
jgi:hypothetical protein